MGKSVVNGPALAGPGVTNLVSRARMVAHTLLVDREDRWSHTTGVAHRAQHLAATVDPADRHLLVAAAWLHDIGYSPTVITDPHCAGTGFHPLDGATYLQHHGWTARICGLVAHHSAARFLAAPLGLDTALSIFPDEQSPLSDALTYADQTTGPHGEPLPIQERIAGMLARHGPDSIQARVHHAREPHLLTAATRVEHRLASVLSATRPDKPGSSTGRGAPAGPLAARSTARFAR